MPNQQPAQTAQDLYDAIRPVARQASAARIETVLAGVKYRGWRFSLAFMQDGQPCVEVSCDTADTYTGLPTKGGCSVPIDGPVTEDSVIAAARAAVVKVSVHEIDEEFIYCDVHVFDPHREERERLGSGDVASCGHPNPVWFTDSYLWNAVVGGDPAKEAVGVLCPSCFADKADVYLMGARRRLTGWRLVPEWAATIGVGGYDFDRGMR